MYYYSEKRKGVVHIKWKSSHIYIRMGIACVFMATWIQQFLLCM